jgi:hypothetical protein
MIEREPKWMLNAHQNCPIFAVVELAIRSVPTAALNSSSEHGGGVLTNLFVTKSFVMPAPGVSDDGGKI